MKKNNKNAVDGKDPPTFSGQVAESVGQKKRTHEQVGKNFDA